MSPWMWLLRSNLNALLNHSKLITVNHVTRFLHLKANFEHIHVVLTSNRMSVLCVKNALEKSNPSFLPTKQRKTIDCVEILRWDLNAHKATHLGPLKHTCSVCARKFRDLVALRRHRRSHTVRTLFNGFLSDFGYDFPKKGLPSLFCLLCVQHRD